MKASKYKISLLDAVVLLYNVQRGAKTKNVGFEDVDHTLSELVALLSMEFSRFTISEEVLESALYSCNMMSEQGQFWSPEGGFKTWLKVFAKRHGFKFDTFFHTIQKIE